MIKSDVWLIHLSCGFSIIGIPVILPLLIGTTKPKREHVVNVLGSPPSARMLELRLYDITMRTFNFARAPLVQQIQTVAPCF